MKKNKRYECAFMSIWIVAGLYKTEIDTMAYLRRIDVNLQNTIT
jgi:hypothetical protein